MEANFNFSYGSYPCKHVQLHGPTCKSKTWLWTILFVIVLIVILLTFAYNNSKSSKKQSRIARSGAARQAFSAAQCQYTGTDSSALYNPIMTINNSGSKLAARRLASRAGTPLSIYSGVSIQLRQNVQSPSLSVMPLSAFDCTTYIVDSGANANQPQQLVNTLDQLAWNNLQGTFLQEGSNSTTPPAFTALTSAPGNISFQQCTGGVNSVTSTLQLGSGIPASYSFPILNGYTCASVPIVPNVTIPQDSFLLRLYYNSSDSNNAITQFDVTVTGMLNGQKFSTLDPISLVTGRSSIPSYYTAEYAAVPTIFRSLVNQTAGTICGTLTELTNPKLDITVVVVNSSTQQTTLIQQAIDIVQLGYAVPPVGTLLFSDSAVFSYNNNPQNVVWLNDAVNWYYLPALQVSAPNRRLHYEPRIMPQNSEVFSSLAAFAAWKLKYGINYNSAAENDSRYAIFKRNIARISQLNGQQPRARYGATKFADLTFAEVQKYYIGPSGAPPRGSYTPRTISKDQFYAGKKRATLTPTSWDWRDHNAVTDVKNQGQSLTCWAFTATGAIEGQWALSTGNLLSFSEQQLVDCSQTFMNSYFGTMDTLSTFNYIVALSSQNGGQMPLALYPFTGNANPTCSYVPPKSSNEYAQIGSWAALPRVDGWTPQESIMNYLYEIGPLPVIIDTEDMVQFYNEGIIDPPNCTGQGDHQVLLVGYNSLCSTPYWILKNSWGTEEGVDGYIYLQQTPSNSGQAICSLNEWITAAFTQTAVPSYVTPLTQWAGLINPYRVGSNAVMICFSDAQTMNCASYTSPSANMPSLPIPFGNNILQYNDWTSTSTGPSPSPSNYWSLPLQVTMSYNDTVTFNTCNNSSGVQCDTATSITTVTDANNPFVYVIGSGAQGSCSLYTITVPSTVSIAPNTFNVRTVAVPDASQPNVQLTQCSMQLVGFTSPVLAPGNQVSSNLTVTVQTAIPNYTASTYVTLSTTLSPAYNATNVHSLSILVSATFSNGVSLSVTKPISQRYFYVPPLATIIVQPSFATNSLSIVTLNDAVNFFYWSMLVLA